MRVCCNVLIMKLNIPDDKKELFIKTSIWNSVIEVFKSEKNIDITEYLISIQIKWKTILVKTNKPIINSEALILNNKIKKNFWEKLKKLWINFYDFELKYI